MDECLASEVHHPRRGMSWVLLRWRAQRNAIRVTNCSSSRIIQILNAYYVLGLSWGHTGMSTGEHHSVHWVVISNCNRNVALWCLCASLCLSLRFWTVYRSLRCTHVAALGTCDQYDRINIAVNSEKQWLVWVNSVNFVLCANNLLFCYRKWLCDHSVYLWSSF